MHRYETSWIVYQSAHFRVPDQPRRFDHTSRVGFICLLHPRRRCPAWNSYCFTGTSILVSHLSPIQNWLGVFPRNNIPRGCQRRSPEVEDESWFRRIRRANNFYYETDFSCIAVSPRPRRKLLTLDRPVMVSSSAAIGTQRSIWRSTLNKLL